MDLRSLIAKMDAIESNALNEAITLKDVTAAVAGKNNEQERAGILNDLAWKEKLPGLYDPISGNFVGKQSMPTGDMGSGQGYNISASASKDADSTLAKLGLIPKNAKTSTGLGRFFGTSGDMYDKGVQDTSQAVISQQEKAEFIKTSVAKLGELVTKLSTVLAQEKKFNDAVAAQIAKQGGQGAKKTATPAAGANASNATANTTGGPTNMGAPAKFENKDVSIANALVESFGYTANFNEASAAQELGKTAAIGGAGYVGGKAISKVLGKAVPGVGLAFGAADAYDRAKKGDYLGAGLAGLSGAVSLIPGVGWIPALGLDMINVGRDLKGSDDADKGQGASATRGPDPKLQQLQKIIGAKADGIMGPETKQKLTAWQQQNGLSADGIPGPQTYAKAGIKESTNMKTVAEQIRELQARLESIETEEMIEESDEPMMFNKDGKNYALLADGRLVDEEGNLIDGSKPDLPIIGKAELEEGVGSWLGNIFKNFKGGLSGAAKTGGRTATGQFAKAGTAAGIANKTGKFIGKNPMKAGALAGAAGLGAGMALGGPAAAGAGAAQTGKVGGGAGGSATSADQAQAEPQAPEAPSADVQAVIDEIRKLMADMGKQAGDDPTVKQAIDNANKTISGIPGVKPAA